MSSRKRLKRPPFENRWTSGARGWRWYVALERLGVDQVRAELALQELLPQTQLADLAIAPGFVRDWLAFHERRARRSTLRWRVTLAGLAGIAAAGAWVAAWSIGATWTP